MWFKLFVICNSIVSEPNELRTFRVCKIMRFDPHHLHHTSEVGGLPAAVTRFYCSEMPEKQGLAAFNILKSNRYFLLFQIRNTFSRESVCSLQGWRICSRLRWDMCRMRRIRGCSHTLCLRYLPALHWSGTPGAK